MIFLVTVCSHVCIISVIIQYEFGSHRILLSHYTSYRMYRLINPDYKLKVPLFSSAPMIHPPEFPNSQLFHRLFTIPQVISSSSLENIFSIIFAKRHSSNTLVLVKHTLSSQLVPPLPSFGNQY